MNTVIGIPIVVLDRLKEPIFEMIGKQYTYLIEITLEVILFVLF